MNGGAAVRAALQPLRRQKMSQTATPSPPAPRPEYQVDLTTFRGPLDLLLYLVKHNEVDICDIPIAVITEQYLGYLNLLQMIDVEGVGEFLIMAATLMEIKSRLLLPRAEEGEKEEDDPRL